MPRFEVIERTNLNTDRWNERCKSSNLKIYIHSDYLDATTNQIWFGLVWGDYERILPFYTKSKWGIKYICMPPFTQQFDSHLFTTEELQEVFGILSSTYWKIDYRISTLQPNFFKQTTIKSNFVLDIQLDYSEISSNYDSVLKRNLKKSSSLKLEQYEHFEDVKGFLYQQNLFKELVIIPFETPFKNILKLNESSNDITIQYYAAKKDLDIVAVLITARYQGIEYLLFPYTSTLGRSQQAMSFLIDQLIQRKQSSLIDFEGSTIDSIAQFYRQFGAEEVRYLELSVRKWNL